MSSDNDCTVPISNVNSNVLKIIIDYCTYHYKHKNDNDNNGIKNEIAQWDEQFCSIDNKTLLDCTLVS